eukprot:1364879-Lingulodinium_polyedra.AAC.1
MHWPCIGHALAMHWPFTGYSLAIHWPFIGHLLAIPWLFIGQFDLAGSVLCSVRSVFLFCCGAGQA